MVNAERAARTMRTDGRDMLMEARKLTEEAHQLIPRLPVHAQVRDYFESLHDLARTVAMLDPDEARALLAVKSKVCVFGGAEGGCCVVWGCCTA